MHYTHYGRICPIETPEGPNIGLISSLATYARVNEFGFLETPYRKVENGKVTERDRVPDGRPGRQVHHRPGERAARRARARSSSDRVMARYRGDLPAGQARGSRLHGRLAEAARVSAAAALIPFLEHDDANRALMGSQHAAPGRAAPADRGAARRHRHGAQGRAWTPARVDRRATRTAWSSTSTPTGSWSSRRTSRERRTSYRSSSTSTTSIELTKFKRSNQDTCINQKPLVERRASRSKTGDVLADGPATERRRAGARAQRAGGLHAVARVQLRGRHHHQRAAGQGRRLHLDPHRGVRARRSATPSAARKRSPAKSRTSAKKRCKNLDENGIIRIGAEVEAGRHPGRQGHAEGRDRADARRAAAAAIFGEKAGDVRDASLKAPPGHGGHRHRHQASSAARRRDDRAKKQDKKQHRRAQAPAPARALARYREAARQKLRELLDGETSRTHRRRRHRRGAGRSRHASSPSELLDEIDLDDARSGRLAAREDKVNDARSSRSSRSGQRAQRAIEDELRERDRTRSSAATNCRPASCSWSRCTSPSKRKLSVGDKMAGRHGNKGVVAKIVPRRTCRTCRTARRWTSCSTRSACRRV